MRVLHINHEKTWRGGERQTLMAVREQRRLNIDAWLACRIGAPLEQMAREEGEPIISIPHGTFAALVALARQMPNFDVLHCHSARAHSLMTLAGGMRAKPLVVSRRVDFLPRKSWFNRFKYNRADKVVCVSRYIAEQMRDWGLPSEKLRIIYDAAEADAPWRSKEECLQELRARVNIGAGKRLVGNIAALVGHKDHATLLHAARVVASQRSDVAFIIIGEGELRDELLRLQAELGLQTSVHFLGFIPQAQNLLPAFDIFAMSSCMEGLGSIVLEANLAGIPVAATAGGGLPEIVSDKKTGLLVPVGDASALAEAILTLLSDGPFADRLAKTAQARTREEFSAGQMAQQYIEVYREVLSADSHSA